MELSRICSDGISESSNSTRFHPPPVSELLLGDIENSPSKTRRHKGLGSASIQCKTITLHGKDYPQAWYHYEFWKDGDAFSARRYANGGRSHRLLKKCKYIPKRLLDSSANRKCLQ
ncbi:hypothetical protein [Nostoc sp. NMS7]|uniref:hypothetical protein n=1 Tax=Nostoc sp. NMS7 TaxID=2815391 RepID=UPI0025D28FC6|nr:hypothetical protein [Nostoc sp. NMS7]